jgi:GT2 family glycosyltransferase
VKCSVIIVSFNQFEPLRAAIASVVDNPPPFPTEVIVVDNHSDADVQEYLNDFFHDVRVIRNPANRGFGWANNQGAQAARGEFLLFLNSDAELLDDALARMVRLMEAEATVGIIGPKLLNGNGSFQLSFGRRISLASELYQKCLAPTLENLRQVFSRPTAPARDVGWVSGACLLTRRELFLAEPVFDTAMFLYFEDHDLCLRVRAMGKRVTFLPTARVRHHGGRSMKAVPAMTEVEYRRSQLYLYRKYLAPWQLRVLRRYLQRKFRRRLRRANDAQERQVSLAVLDMLKK